MRPLFMVTMLTGTVIAIAKGLPPVALATLWVGYALGVAFASLPRKR